ncbi:hypothetical protein OC861_004728 [Tilletia horrida]|nr:hypothetical protein OC861_004728 [Tilletia horrida]
MTHDHHQLAPSSKIGGVFLPGLTALTVLHPVLDFVSRHIMNFRKFSGPHDEEVDEKLIFSESRAQRRSSTWLRVVAFLFFLVAGVHFLQTHRPFACLQHVPQLTGADYPFPHPVNATYPPVDSRSRSPVAPWRPCPAPYNRDGLDCSYVRVPKDYFNASKGFAYVAVGRIRATAKPEDQLGALYLNPGGPGGSGVGLAASLGKILSVLTHGKYDVIGFDPRGIGATRPIVDCFGSTYAYNLFKAGTVREHPFEVHPDPFSEEGREVLLRQWTELHAMRETEMKICLEKMGDDFLHMGTSDVVRDISYLNFEAGLGKGHPINYWGGSYGSILGTYLVNMLPASSLGRVAIDGVSSARLWSETPPERWIANGWLVDTEETYMWNLRECSEAGPEACPLAKKKNEDVAKIDERLMKFLDDLYYEPLAVPGGPRPGVLTSGAVRGAIYAATNVPSAWPRIASWIARAMEGDGTAVRGSFFPDLASLDRNRVDQLELSRAAVGCHDTVPYNDPNLGNWSYPTPKDMTQWTLDILKKNSRRFAPSVPYFETDGGCQWFPKDKQGRGRFSGPWNNTLNTPMLVISNVADPITPRAYGQEVIDLMGASARLLTVNTSGHGTYGGAPSICAWDALQRYLVSGELPEEGKMCQRDRGNFDKSNVDILTISDTALDNAAHNLQLLSEVMTDRFAKFSMPHIF